MINKKISVIVPVYGTEKYIDKCLSSVLNQTYKNLEILVVNDGSKDCSKMHIGNIVTGDSFKNQPNDIYIEKKNLIIKIRINIGKKHSKIVFLKIESGIAREKYFSILDDLTQMILLEDDAIGDTLSYAVDECLNFTKMEAFDASNVYDEVIIEIRKKSYAISSELTCIKYIEHYQNEGLYQARLTGYEYACGEYITTIDSDDYYGIDYLRLMLKRIEETDADVVISEMVRENLTTGYKGKRTHAMNAIRYLDLYGEEIADFLFNSEGELSPMWFVWGKLYKKTLWDKCYNDLKSVEGHHIMLEDLMYGVVFTLNANHYVYCDADTYFYVANENASTSNNGSSEKLFKNLKDVLYAFNHIEEYLKKKNKYKKYSEKFDCFKAKWSRTWYEIQEGYELSSDERETVLEQLKELSPTGVLELPDERDIYFYENNTPWDNRLEQLKKVIVTKEIVSFDIFDTLIVRPFYKPSDLFVLMDDEYKRLTDTHVKFSDMRVEAEKQARKRLKYSGSQFEDITLDEIYRELQQIYGVSKEIAQLMSQLEIKLESQFSRPRKKIKEIYELAQALGKRVVFSSDMYLPKDVVISILEKNGYIFENNLYLSSDIFLSKTTGNLYVKMLDTEGYSAEKCIHIGDNWKSDCEQAKALGISSWYTPKTIDFLFNKVADINKGKHRGNYGELLNNNLTGSFVRFTQALDYFGIRCMLAIIANKVFDNPYGDWEADTDFNRNPYNIGYIALGMHEYGIVRWLMESIDINKKIFFVARDGYLAMKVYEVIKEKEKNIPDFGYFHMSRKSFLPLSIVDVDDWWSIKENINYIGKSPEEIIQYYKPILPDYNNNVMASIFSKYGILYGMPLSDEGNYIRFINAIQKELHNQKIINRYREEMKECLSKIFKEGDAMFDIGYSGRAQAILSRLLGYGVNAYYVHTLNDRAEINAKKYHFHVQSFFDFSPALTGKIRELVQSEPSPSCVGYSIDDNVLKPLYEDKNWRFHEKYVINQMQDGAVQFVRDFMDTFKGYIDRMTYRKTDISFIHEKLIMLPKKQDMEVFKLFHFEDDLFFDKNYEKKWLVDIWNGDLKWNKFPNYSIIHKREREVLNSTIEKNNIIENNTKKSHSYQPYKLVPDVPQGLINRIKYFHNNDHIILKKYVADKGKMQYELFNVFYNVLSNVKHIIKGENKVGNKVSDYRLNSNGKILYNATSSYGLLCCIVHKLIFHPDEKADLMLSSWRKDKLGAVSDTHFFDEVFMWSDMKYRDVSYAMDKILINATELDKIEQEYRFFGIYERLIPFKINEYKSIVIAGNSMPFGDFLERNEVQYSIIEDGAGLYCDYSLLLHSIDQTYPLIEKYMIDKYRNLQGGKCCQNIYINENAQMKDYDCSRTIDFAPVELIETLTPLQRQKIFKIYGVKEAAIVNKKKACLLLTYPLAQREKFTVNEEKMCFALLADIFGYDCDEIHLKAHPDDRTDFTDIDGLIIVNRNVLSELLWYEKKTIYKKVYATVSTSTNNLLCAEKKVAFDSMFCQEYKYLIKYYIAVMLMAHQARKENRVWNVFMEDVYVSLVSALIDTQDKLDATESVLFDCVISKTVTERVETSKMAVILDAPSDSENYRKLVIKKSRIKNYDFLDLNSEEIYVSKEFKIEEPIFFEMKICGMKIQVYSMDNIQDRLDYDE